MNERMVVEAPQASSASPASAGMSTATSAPRAPAFYGFSDQYGCEADSIDKCSWYIRGQNFCIGYAWVRAGESLSEVNLPDEHIVIVPEATAVTVFAPGDVDTSIVGPVLAIIPAGASRLVAGSDGGLLRIFTARSADVRVRADNNATYGEPDPAVVPLPDRPPVPGPGTVRVYLAADIPVDSARFGRIFRSDSLMVNWFAPEHGARDTDSLSPHVHDSFEQATVTLLGEYTHHLRSPWTPRLRDWRSDQHIKCASPSITIIPPGIVHTSRAIGEGMHHLVDVFAPPRADFAARGWVINAQDYEG